MGALHTTPQAMHTTTNRTPKSATTAISLFMLSPYDLAQVVCASPMTRQYPRLNNPVMKSELCAATSNDVL
jgi:hypothetical protein